MVKLNKRILCIIFLGMLLINFSSAFEFDNVKKYNPISREVMITNAYGLGNTIGIARLNTPINVKVGAGYQKVAEFDLLAYQDYNDILKQFSFIDMKDGTKINRNIDIKILNFKKIKVIDYKIKCFIDVKSTNKTKTKDCNKIAVGSHLETRKVWTKLTKTNLKKNKRITIGLFTEVKVGDYVDWIPTIYGVKIKEWASWTADLNTNLVSYYKLDETSGTVVIDSLGTNDGVNYGSTVNQIGKIGTAYDFDGINDYLVTNSNVGIIGFSSRTLNFWISPNTLSSGPYIVSWGTTSTNSQFGLRSDNTGQLYAWTYATDFKIGDIGTGSYIMLTLTYDGTTVKGYINGISGGSSVLILETTDSPLVLGKYQHGSSNYFDGKIDEIGIWNRALTPTEITQLYNGGAGISYTNNFQNDNAPNIKLNSPSSTNYTVPQNLEFNFTVSDDINLSSVKLYVNNILNQTNASGINNTDYLFNINLGDGIWEIYGKATDNESNENSTAPIIVSINSTPFIEFITPPTLNNYANISQSYIPIKVNVSTDIFKNITYSLRSANGTNYTKSFTNQTYNINFTNVQDGHYDYDVIICAITDKCNNTEIRHINEDITAPIINLTSPTGIFDFLIAGYSLNLNWSVLDEAENLDSCWYIYNNITTLLNCSLNTTTFNYVNLKNDVVFYSNDTFGNIGNETISWGYLILQTNQTYNSQVTEGTPNTITTFLNVVGDTISSAYLSYNGTNYTTSLDYDSGNYTMVSTVVAPLVVVDTNITFQVFMMINGIEYSIPETTQLIQAINFSICTTGDKLLNIFLLNEEDKTDILGTIEINAGLVSKISGEAIESVTMEVSNVSNLSICLDPISSVNNFYLDADIVYSSEDYAKEFYFMRNANLSIIPINLSLFDLNLNSSTEFLLRYQGQDLIKVEGAIVQLQRYYISEGIYETVEAPLTSISGTAIVHIDLNTNKYKAIVVKDGVVLDIFNDIVFDCENELSGQCTQNLYADVTPYNIIDGGTLKDFSYAISDTGDKLITTFSIPSGSTNTVNIVMTQKDQFGETTSCNRTVTTSSGSLECSYNKTIGDSYLFLEINKNGKSQVEKEYFIPEANGIDWGGVNWLFLFGLLISVSLMAISSPEWIVGNSVVVLIIGGSLWMADGLNIVAGLGLIVWIISAAIILILEMSNKEDR